MNIIEEIENSGIETCISVGDLLIKEYYMESSSKTTIPDPSKKWIRFKNWVSRVITTILAKTQSKKYKESMEKCKSFDAERDNFEINSRDKGFLDSLCDKKARDEYENKGLSYDKNAELLYKSKSKHYQKMINIVKRYDDYPNKRIKVNGALLKKYMAWISNEGKKMATELPNVNKYLKEISDKLTDDDRKTATFQQYTQSITLMMQLDLLLVKKIYAFMEDFRLNNDLKRGSGSVIKSGGFSGDENSQQSSDKNNPSDFPSGNSNLPKVVKKDSHNCDIWESKPSCFNSAKIMEDVDEISDGCKKVIRFAANKFVKDKYPNADEAYVAYNESKDMLIFGFNAKEDSSEDWRGKSMTISAIENVAVVGGMVKKFMPSIKSALTKNGTCYLKL